jgi:hypothetical protein
MLLKKGLCEPSFRYKDCYFNIRQNLGIVLSRIRLRRNSLSSYRISTPLVGILGLFFFTTSSAWAAEENLEDVSGYLGPEVYKKLVEVEIRDGTRARRWIGPKLNFANYKKVLIEEVVLHPKPEPNPQVSQELLDEVTDYLTLKLVDKMGAVLQLSFDPGPDVVRVQAAITGVEITTEGMQVKELVPIAAIFGGIKAITGNRNQDVLVFFEVKFTDSMTGEMIGALVRRIEGKQLEGVRDQLRLEHLEESLDQASSDGGAAMKRMIEEE